MLALEITFWIAAGLIVYSYAIYPVILRGLVRLSKWRQREASASQHSHGENRHVSAETQPFVSLIIAAYKEESIILQRLHNALQMDYPADRLEIIVGCDGAEDNTGELVKTIDDSRVKLMQFPQRRGKPSVLNDCVLEARGEILTFSDANTFWEPQALKKLVRHFQAEKTGGVCGQLVLTDPETGENVDGLYWRYENFLKKCEGKLGALLGVNGAIYAIRKEMWEPIPANSIVDDFLIGMRVHLKQHKLIFEEEAIAHEESAPTMGAEFHRRARIGAGGFQSLVWLAKLLLPTYGMVSLAFWSHKVLRWFCPLFMIVALITNVALIQIPVYQYLLVAQLAFYGLALLGNLIPGNGFGLRLVRLTSMFLNMNAALAVGFWRWFRNTQTGVWKRTARSQEATTERTPKEPIAN